MSEIKVPVGISNRHVHLSQSDLETLFGKGYRLTPVKDLSQPSQFACKETVSIVGLKGKIDRVRILGPVRSATQVEISKTDSFILGIHPPVRESGSLSGSPGITIEGPAGRIELQEGVIIAQRHIHLHTEEAAQFGLSDRDLVTVKFKGERELIFGRVTVRVNPNFKMELHLDTDEANAAGITNGTLGTVLKNY